MADSAALRALPVVALEPCEKRAARVSSTALVRYRTNDYSVPTAYGFQDVVVKGFVDEVVVICGADVIARDGALTAAYIAADTLSVQPSRQRYEQISETHWRYYDLGVAAGFTANLHLDEDRLVKSYEGLFEVILRSG